MYQITDEARKQLLNHLAQVPYYIAQPLLAFIESNVVPVTEEKTEEVV